MEDIINCAILFSACLARKFLSGETEHYGINWNDLSKEEEIEKSKGIVQEADNLPDEIKRKFTHYVFHPMNVHGCRPPEDSPFYDIFVEHHKK